MRNGRVVGARRRDPDELVPLFRGRKRNRLTDNREEGVCRVLNQEHPVWGWDVVVIAGGTHGPPVVEQLAEVRVRQGRRMPMLRVVPVNMVKRRLHKAQQQRQANRQ